MWKKILVRSLLGLLAVVAGLAVTVAVRRHRTFEAPYPELHASQDPAVIERGRYLAYGPAHCVDCHGDTAHKEDPKRALIGGYEFHLPVGTVYTRNITPDKQTGIGRYSDREVARILRYGVHADGRAVIPFMPFADLADDDLTAILSFLRSQKPVRHDVPKHELNVLGDAVMAFVIAPKGPTKTPVRSVTIEPTAEYGAYLANSVGNCVNCHTELDMKTGERIGAPFAGGHLPSEEDPTKIFASPNLTPDPRWGWINGWTEDTFVARLSAGPVHKDSPMPWNSFRTISETDARALYRYLRTLPPAKGGPDPLTQQVVASAAH